MITYATSSVFAPILQNTNAPMILLSLQPLQHLDYSKACTYMQLENDNICSVPEFTGVAIRMGKPITDVVIGCFYGDEGLNQIAVIKETNYLINASTTFFSIYSTLSKTIGLK